MAQSLVADELLQRLSRARAISRTCTEHAIRLVQDATAGRDWAIQVRLDAIELRERWVLPRGAATISSFPIRALVDDAPAEARFEDGQLHCSEEVLRRAA